MGSELSCPPWGHPEVPKDRRAPTTAQCAPCAPGIPLSSLTELGPGRAHLCPARTDPACTASGTGLPCASLPMSPALPLCPLPTLPHLLLQYRSSGTAMAHEAQGAQPSSAAPTCLWAASQARKSQRFLTSPGPEAFSSFQAGHSPARRSSLTSSFQAGAGGLGSGLSCAASGCSPNTWGWAMPG